MIICTVVVVSILRLTHHLHIIEMITTIYTIHRNKQNDARRSGSSSSSGGTCILSTYVLGCIFSTQITTCRRRHKNSFGWLWLSSLPQLQDSTNGGNGNYYYCIQLPPNYYHQPQSSHQEADGEE
jgi:hypothetical protein